MSLPLKIVLLIVLGIALAIASPNFQNARQRGHQKKTMGDMRSLATAIESYSIDSNMYPAMIVTTPAQMDALARMLEPTYTKETPRRDGWGTPLVVVSTPREYSITSYGKDRVPDSVGHSGTIAPNGGTTVFSADIVFSTGSFVQFPDGTMS